MLFKVGQFFLLLALEGTHALEHFVPVDQCTVELRAVNADELRLAANGQSACTAHTSTIHHDGIQADFAGNVMLLSREVRELHHDGRTDGENLVDMFLLNKLFDTNRHYTLFTVCSIISHDNNLVRTLANLIFKDDQVL